MSLRVQKPGRSRPAPMRHPDRPPIWVDGRQSPRFELQAFLRATLSQARGRSAQGLEASAQTALRLAPRLPRLAAGTSALCNGAARVLRGQPGDEPDCSEMTAALASAFPRPAGAPVPATIGAAPASPPRSSDDDPTLAAIRAVLRADDLQRRADRPAPAPALAPALSPAPAGGLARTLAALTITVLLPVSAASTLYAHLSGEDLRLSG